MITTIQPIPSYSQTAQLKECIESAVAQQPWIATWKNNPDAKRLVVVKPNWVQEAHEYKPDVWEPVITHPVLVLVVIEVLAERMQGTGTICLCDAPHTYANFEEIVARGDLRGKLEEVRSRWPSLKLELLDLRREIWLRRDEVVVDRRSNTEDPRGYVNINLGQESLFYGHRGEGSYYGADYDTEVVRSHHRGETQEYLLARTAVACDALVNLAKLKTHKKTGVTCCLKNLVGINGDKNWLPHHTEGAPRSGGDEFPYESVAHFVERRIKRAGMQVAMAVPGLGSWLYRKIRNAGKTVLGDSEKVIRNGNWYGNDTCWRMVLDLNRALLYGNPDGTLRQAEEAKNYLAIVDGIVGGEGNGPLCPDPVEAKVIVVGDNPAEVDAVCCKLMGFDPRMIPLVHEAFCPHRWPIARWPMEKVRVLDGRAEREIALDEVQPAVQGGFRPHFGWKQLNPNKG